MTSWRVVDETVFREEGTREVELGACEKTAGFQGTLRGGRAVGGRPGSCSLLASPQPWVARASVESEQVTVVLGPRWGGCV